jgi:hypothetical protein
MTIECPRCEAHNPDGNRFCGDCGAPLDPTFVAIKDIVRDQVNGVIKDNYKDQKLLEVETAQAVASRLSDWAKLFGFFVGIPIAILLLVLGGLGIKTYSDFASQVDKAQNEVAAHLQDAQERAAKLRTEGESLAQDYERLSAQFSDTKALAEQLKTLSAKVDVIGEKLGFTPTSNVSSDTKNRLEAAFDKFRQYYTTLGYRSAAETVNLDIRAKMDIAGALSYYDPDKRMMVIDAKYAEDPIVLYREYSHHVLYSSGIPKDPNSMFWSYYAIESSLAWYFPCSFVNNPKPPTAASSWDLSKKRQFNEMKPNVTSAMIDGTEIWGNAFWEMRMALGQEVADRILFETWFKMQPDDVRSDRGTTFVRKLIEADKTHEAQIRSIFVQRGLAL